MPVDLLSFTIPGVPLGCNNGFLCWATNSCLDHDLKCNGKVDCPDGTDESNCCELIHVYCTYVHEVYKCTYMCN